jgi:hypothetical protein
MFNKGYFIKLKCLLNIAILTSCAVSILFKNSFADFSQTVKTITPSNYLNNYTILTLIYSGKYMKVDSMLTTLNARFLTSNKYEFPNRSAIDAFYISSMTLEKHLNNWVEKYPTSKVALLARSNYYLGQAWKCRGNKWARETPDQNFVEMNKYLGHGIEDLEKVIKTDSTWFTAYYLLYNYCKLKPDQFDVNKIFKMACNFKKDCFSFYAFQIQTKQPRWGGSYSEMENVLNEGLSQSINNPMITLLKGYIDWDKSTYTAKNADEELQFLNSSLENGDYWQFNLQRAGYYYEHAEYLNAIKDYKKVLIQLPYDSHSIAYIGYSYYSLGYDSNSKNKYGYYSKAKEYLLAAECLDPENINVQKYLKILK